jgi:hypothetical protein
MNDLLEYDITSDEPAMACPLCGGPVSLSQLELLDSIDPTAPHCQTCGVVLAG